MGAIWAITRHTLMMTMRRKAALALLVFFAVGTPAVTLFAEGDNTLVGLLKVVTTWNFRIMSMVLMCMMVYLGATTLYADIRDKQIFLVDTKPAGRWKIMLGKWLGLTLLSGWLILIMTCYIYVSLMILTVVRKSSGWLMIMSILAGPVLTILGFIAYNAITQGKEKKSPWISRIILLFWTTLAMCASIYGAMLAKDNRGPGKDAFQVKQAYEEFYISRRSFRPELPDINRQLKNYENMLRARGRLTEEDMKNPEKLRARLLKAINKKVWPIEYMASREFVFHHLPAIDNPNAATSIRYKFHGRRGESSGGWIQHEWQLYREAVIDGKKQRFATWPITNTSKSGQFKEIFFNPQMLEKGGDVYLRISNISDGDEKHEPARIMVPLIDGLEMLVPVGSFEANLARAAVLIWIRMAMFAAIGISMSAVLNSSVTALLLFGVMAIGSSSSFIQQHIMSMQNSPAANRSIADEAERNLYSGLLILLKAGPNFDETDPIIHLAIGREVSGKKLLQQIFYDIVLRSGIFVIIGLFAFYRKEVGLPIIN